MRGVVSILGVWVKLLRARSARVWLKTYLPQILDAPVIDCGIDLYLNKNLDSLVSSDSVDNFFIPCLKVLIVHSASLSMRGGRAT